VASEGLQNLGGRLLPHQGGLAGCEKRQVPDGSTAPLLRYLATGVWGACVRGCVHASARVICTRRAGFMCSALYGWAGRRRGRRGGASGGFASIVARSAVCSVKQLHMTANPTEANA